MSEQALHKAVAEIESALIDAYLGNSVVKKRIGVSGRGKSSGVRTILTFKTQDKAFFLYGFAKNQRENIDDKELQALKTMATHFLAYDRKALDKAKKAQELIEVTYEKT